MRTLNAIKGLKMDDVPVFGASNDEAEALAACYRLLLQKAAERRLRLSGLKSPDREYPAQSKPVDDIERGSQQ